MNKCIACGKRNIIYDMTLCNKCYKIYNQILDRNITIDSYSRCIMCYQPLNRCGNYCIDCCRKLNITGSMQAYKPWKSNIGG
jgi:hypothetical protein